MTGGLIQIVAYGTQDLFLTGIPQITFFKVVYRKYTNFAIESVNIELNGKPNFDKQLTTIIPKIGDLLANIYLVVDIPKVEIKDDSYISDQNTIDIIDRDIKYYNNLLSSYADYFKYNMSFINKLRSAIKIINCDWNRIYAILQNEKAAQTITKINLISVNIKNGNSIIEFEKKFPLSSKSKYIGNEENRLKLVNDIKIFVENIQILYQSKEKEIFIKIKELKDGKTELETKMCYFSWVEKLGFNLINTCSVIIGGNEMAKIDSNFLDMYYTINTKHDHLGNLNEIIGNIPELTNYNNIIKNGRKLYIPLPFWFTQHNGNNLPLVSMLYHDIEFNVQLNSLDKCCFFKNDNINLNNILSLGECSLLVDYIYLDIDEKTKFSQYSHEYLIQDYQQIVTNETNANNYSVKMDFSHPVKELFWYVKETYLTKKYKLNNKYHILFLFEILDILEENGLVKIEFEKNNDTTIYYPKNSYINLKYTKYYDGKYKVIETYNNYIVIRAKYINISNYQDNFYGIIYNESNQSTFNPIDKQHIEFNGIDRTSKRTKTEYFNYVIPYQYYNNTPLDGMNFMSFSLHPNEFQPSGACNFSLIKSKTLIFDIKKIFSEYIKNQNLSYDIVIYCINYNVLRIHNGMTVLLFS